MNDEKGFMPKINMIYEKLSDQLSKQIFKNLLLEKITGDTNYLLDMLQDTIDAKQTENKFKDTNIKLIDFIRRNNLLENDLNKKIIFHGNSGGGDEAATIFFELEHFCLNEDKYFFCDNNLEKHGKHERWHIRCFSPEEAVKRFPEGYFIITSAKNAYAMYRQLTGLGVSKSRIFYPYEELRHHLEGQYFDDEILHPEEKEVFIDGGCYDAETSYQFAQWTNNSYEKIYAFEIEPPFLEKIKKNIGKWNLQNIEIIPAGLGKERNTLRFSSNGNMSAFIDEKGEEEVDIVALDEIIKERKITFIKMDIEGAEMDALIGASKIIVNNKPKLAVCVYHKKNDFLEILSYILQLRQDYRLYLRHYTMGRCETVVYAV